MAVTTEDKDESKSKSTEAPECAALRMAFLAQIRALASDDAGPRELNIIKHLTMAARVSLQALNTPKPPPGSVASQVAAGQIQNGGGMSAYQLAVQNGYVGAPGYDAPLPTEINSIEPFTMSGSGGGNGVGMNSETFGATLMRELIATLGAVLKRPEPVAEPVTGPRAEDDHEALCAVIANARKAGLDDIAQKLEKTLLERYLGGRTETSQGEVVTRAIPAVLPAKPDEAPAAPGPLHFEAPEGLQLLNGAGGAS
ncbi:MAG: hypothetical protein ACHREM_00560 [Polyangiales bacterium]